MMHEHATTAYRLSPLQTQLWLEDGIENQSVQGAFLISGNLNVAKLTESFGEVIQRHEIFRSTFVQQPGVKVPFQAVQRELAPSWSLLDWRTTPSSRVLQVADEFLAKQAQEPFHLSHGPVLKLALARLEDGKWVLMITASAACADAQSLRIIAREALSVYANGRTSLPEESLQYADYSEWCNTLFEGEEEEARLAADFWKGVHPAGAPSPQLPLELKHHQNLAQGAVEIPLAPTAANLQGLAAQHRVSLAGLMFALWAGFLARITTQESFVLQHHFEARDEEETSGAAGVFGRYLPIFVDRESAGSIADAVLSIGDKVAAAGKWQHYFMPEYTERTATDLPVGFEYRKALEQYSVNDLQCSELLSTSSRSFKLKLLCSQDSATLWFNTGWFKREDALYLADLFATFLNGVVAAPAGMIASAPLLSEAEHLRLTQTLQQTATPYRDRDCIHFLFEEAVARAPQTPAVACNGEVLSYRDLNAKANQLAHLLRKHGVGPNVPVALCMERSAEIMVAMLGILKAGGAYVPLVHDNPKSRIAHQLAETKAPVLITQQRLLSNLPEFKGETICMDRDSARLALEPTADPVRVNSSEDLVYVIYTSGSTGLPKGVAVRHRNLMNYTQAICGILGTQSGENTPWNYATVSTLSADLGNTCIFPGWASGGCVHVIDYETSMDARLFAEYAEKYPIDVMKITPSHLSALLALPSGTKVLPRRFLFCGGDALSWELVQQVAAHSEATIVNHYGPTETTIGSLTLKLDKGQTEHVYATKVPIGRPIANTRVYILDPAGDLVPVGVAGELHIAGAGVAREYLQQPAETAARFVPNKFAAGSGERMYRTGDRARYLPDGTVEFLGRVDHQVKIRGYRVEPGEIEAVLKTNAGVRQAAVLVLDDSTGDKQLVGFVVPNNNKLTGDQLRAFAAEHLPDYMVPSRLSLIKELPLTSNGKVDRQALIDRQKVSKQEDTYVAPTNDVEEGVASIWAQVLKLPRVSTQDNFFSLGGHSLLATQVISRIQNGFGVQVPLRALFEMPTVAALSRRVADLQKQQAEDPEIAGMLGELENLSEEEAERLLAAESAEGASNGG